MKFRLMPAHEPTGPQSVGGLNAHNQHRIHGHKRNHIRELHHLAPVNPSFVQYLCRHLRDRRLHAERETEGASG